jgi:hypothetical protein
MRIRNNREPLPPVNLPAKRVRAALTLACMCAMLIGVWAAAGPVSAASANTYERFCYGNIMQPYGHSGDRCYSGWEGKGSGHYLYGVIAFNYDKSSCVDAVEWSALVGSWACAPPG